MGADSIGLYVHIPFCASRCHYCTFVSNTYEENLADAYLNALQAEIAATAASIPRFSTLFVGGGTPSALSSRQLDKLLAMLPRDGAKEITVEANPESASDEKLRLLRDGGVTRISLGVQTFSPQGLELLGRPHDPATARERVAQAVGMGFHSVNMDLIAGWPTQSEFSLREDLTTAADLGVTHLSCYDLIHTRGSALSRMMRSRGLCAQTESEARDFWDLAERLLEDRGFTHYEISNYCRPGYPCRHNLDIWKGGRYVGVGVAAHSHVDNKRSWNNADITAYIADIGAGRSTVEGFETLEPEAKARETAVFWLRLAEGIDAGEFAAVTGRSLEQLYTNELPRLLGAGVLEWHPQGEKRFLRLTKQGYPIADAALVDMV